MQIPEWRAQNVGLPVHGSFTIHEITNLIKELPPETAVLLLIEAKRCWQRSAVQQYEDARRGLTPAEHPSGLTGFEMMMRRMDCY